MIRIEKFSVAERARLTHADGLPAFDASQIDGHAADVHLCALSPAGEVLAHCSLWWKETPSLPGHAVGAVGHYASVDSEAATALLGQALTMLGEHGCNLAIGPMDGNTWRRYRFVTDAGPSGTREPAFFLEPANSPEWPRQFVQAGFAPLAEYYSALNHDLTRTDPRLDVMAERLASAGVRIRSARGCDLNQQLRRIYQVSRIAFTRNFLYTELPEDLFLAQYAPLLSRIEPELILLAERDHELAGYTFAIPDFAQAARGCAMDTFLIKTVAILPQPELRGLGGVLVGLAQQAGRRLGFKRCIHALMHENNISRNISSHYAATMRRYTLYSRELAR
jgi:GNAT superfamily N-acetyltransferase